MKTLSVRQPWAWLIIMGYKTVENRTWQTGHRGPLLICASKTLDVSRPDWPKMVARFRREGIALPRYDELLTGGIIGKVDLVDVTLQPTEKNDLLWHDPDFYAWILRNPSPLPYLAVEGRLHLFEVAYPLAFG